MVNPYLDSLFHIEIPPFVLSKIEFIQRETIVCGGFGMYPPNQPVNPILLLLEEPELVIGETLEYKENTDKGNTVAQNSKFHPTPNKKKEKKENPPLNTILNEEMEIKKRKNKLT